MTKQVVNIAPEVAEEIRRILAEIPDKNSDRRRKFTTTEDALILAGWESKSQVALARKLGISINTLRRRHLELTEGV